MRRAENKSDVGRCAVVHKDFVDRAMKDIKMSIQRIHMAIARWVEKLFEIAFESLWSFNLAEFSVFLTPQLWNIIYDLEVLFKIDFHKVQSKK